MATWVHRFAGLGPRLAPHRAGSVAAGAALAALGASAGFSALIATRILDPNRTSWFVTAVGIVVIEVASIGVAAYRLGRPSTLMLIMSPYGVAAATWLLLFVYRPVELYFAPDHAARSVAQLGFTLGDVTRTVALVGIGCATWGLGYVLAVTGRHERVATRRSEPPADLSGRGATVALVLGTGLWLILFFRQGGVSALLASAASIRAQQLSSSYAFIGLWIVQGVALYALFCTLRGSGPTAKRVLLASAPLIPLAAIALQLRLLATLAAVSALALFLAIRGVTVRRALAFAGLALVGALALTFFQQVREYSLTVRTSEAVRLTFRTPVEAMYVSDLSTFDNFVAIQSLVPDSLAYLDGQTIAEIPQAFVPRALWPEKPLGIDFLTSSYLYPGIFVAIPISVQGELYWNGGPAAIALGAFVLGALLGLLARVGAGAPPTGGLFFFYALTFPFTHAFLTRGLATMLQNLAFALIGVSIAILAMSPSARSQVVHRLRRVTGRLPRPRPV